MYPDYACLTCTTLAYIVWLPVIPVVLLLLRDHYLLWFCYVISITGVLSRIGKCLIVDEWLFFYFSFNSFIPILFLPFDFLTASVTAWNIVSYLLVIMNHFQ